MVNVGVESDRAVFEVEGWDKLWSLRSRLEIPLAHVKGVHADPGLVIGWFDGLKLAGTGLPHLFRAGTFYQHGDLVFWDVRHPEKAVIVELEHEHFAKLIVEVEDPAAAVARLESARSARR